MWSTLLNRVAIVLLAAAFLGGSLPQIAPAAMTGHAIDVAGTSGNDMAGMDVNCPGDNDGSPHKPAMDCPFGMTCTAPAAALLGTAGTPVLPIWTSVSYSGLASRFIGVTVPPDLTPPILLV
jgi:hypothetical protein